MAFQHKELAEGRWRTFSLAEQLGNVGSEVRRAAEWQHKDEQRFSGAVNRALELFDLTLTDDRWNGRKREIARAREVFCDAVYGGTLYHSTLKDFVPYFDQFAFAARQKI